MEEGTSSFAWIINAYKSDDSDDDSASNVSSGVAVRSIGPNRWSETRDKVDENQDLKSSTENRTDSIVRDRHKNDCDGKGGKGIGAEDRKTSVLSRRKRSRSGSRQHSDNKNNNRKRKRRFSETESGSLCLLGESRSNVQDSEERKKDKNVDTLQLRIDQLKEEIERAKQDIGLDRKDMRNKSGSSERKTSHRKRRSRSRSLKNKSSSRTDHRSKSKSFEHREKSPPTSDDR